ADEWNFPGRAVHPHVGHVIEPGPGLGGQGPKTAEGETLEEVASDVAHGALDLAFGFWASRTMDAGLNAVVLGKLEELRVRLHLAILPAADGHGLHVVVEDALRHALEVVKRIHVAALQNAGGNRSLPTASMLFQAAASASLRNSLGQIDHTLADPSAD